MKVLVTGATGMLGRHLAQHLSDRGEEVAVLQRGESGLSLTEFRGDVANAEVAARACEGQDAIIHLAAKVSVVGAWEDFEHTNMVGTTNLLKHARVAGVTRFVQVSSPSVAHAGEPLVGVPAQPADASRARGHYARSKALAELSALAEASDDLAVVAVRPHLVWGPGDTQLVGRIIDRARSGRLVLIDRGTALIDSTYVDNAVTALAAALDRAPEVNGEAFVVTNGEPRTVAELLTRICRSRNVPEPTRSIPRRLAGTVGWFVEKSWQARGADNEPPMTKFLAEQLSTAHWFEQQRTRQALQWSPHVSLAEGFMRLAAHAD